ncbi:MAG: molecular chaperone DnaJ [Armatimonadetes bacterium]|nr:molecular chaperone DnaJ [Armatimonadota bacterium]
MTDKRDYYEVLGLSRNATQDDVKQAFRTLARRYHPDVNKEKDAEAKFKEINEAYDVLSDDQKRQAYDRFGHDGLNGAGMGASGMGFGFNDIFESFFGTASRGSSTASSATRGDDLRQDMEITLEEAALGVTKGLRYTHLETCDLCEGSGAQPGTQADACSACRGTGYVRHTQNTLLGTFQTTAPCGRCRGEGRIVTTPCSQCAGNGRMRKTRERSLKIPAGVDTGSRIRLSGEGDAGLRGGPTGDLYVVLHVQAHAIFERRDRDLYCEAPVSFALAALGGQIEVPIIGGTERLTIPEGTQTGASFVIKAKGMPDLNGYGRGNQYVVLRVEVPRKMTNEQKQALRQYAAAMGEETPDDDKGLFSRLFRGDR